MVPHARTLRKAREQVKAMVTDDVSSESMGAKVAKTSSTWNYKERSHAYIKSCCDPFAAKIAAFVFQQNYFTELCSCQLVALVA